MTDKGFQLKSVPTATSGALSTAVKLKERMDLEDEKWKETFMSQLGQQEDNTTNTTNTTNTNTTI